MKGTYSLLCYTREATGREEANNEDIAYSMHLALRASETAEWEPLNENYGILSRRACLFRPPPPSRAERASRRRISSPIRSMRRIRPPMPSHMAR